MALVRLLMDAAGGGLLPTGEGQEEARERARAEARRLFMVADTDASGTLGFPEFCALPGHAGLRHASQGRSGSEWPLVWRTTVTKVCGPQARGPQAALCEV